MQKHPVQRPNERLSAGSIPFAARYETPALLTDCVYRTLGTCARVPVGFPNEIRFPETRDLGPTSGEPRRLVLLALLPTKFTIATLHFANQHPLSKLIKSFEIQLALFLSRNAPSSTNIA